MNIKMRRLVIIGISFLYIILVFILFFLLGNTFLKYLEFLNCCFSLLLLIITIKLLGYREYKFNRLKYSILFITLIIILAYFTIFYSFGLFNGFLRNSFSLSIKDIVNNALFVILSIIFLEIFRYVFISSNEESKSGICLVTVMLFLLEYCNYFNVYNYNNSLEILKFGSLFVIPTLVKNATLSYLCKYSGFCPGMVYRLLIECYIYFVPLVPNLGEFMDSAFLIVLPFVIYMSISKVVTEHYYLAERVFNEKVFSIWDVPFVISFSFMVLIVSGIGPLSLVGIASASMEPDIMVGDAVLLKKVKENERFQVGDIIAFKRGGRMVVHRIVDIIEENGEFYYDTKGDNNNSDDGIYIGIDDIDGRYILKIPYIAKLSLWINERRGG